MGFDNDCILSIQSLAGEYFCPVCRLLVYPNEALQSQCTHLYCKPCLTYVVSTTRACPYDGYLVTEADSKPLVETNKLLAETIGKIGVHCLYHRSGCSWLGSLSDCVSHCSGCTYGNSPVVCNRCAVQIVHRQVQEHAQSCPGVPAQAQADVGAATSAPADQTQAATQNAATVSSSQPQAVAQAAVPNAEQWYQQQQNQYQQYYQQHPGYDQYQQQYQQYYHSQQESVPVASNLQAPVANQPQNQAQQVHPGVAQQTYPLQPQQQPYTQYPQPQPQIQAQVQPYPQTNKDPNAATGHPSYPQSYVRPQNPIQQPTQMGPPHSHATVLSQQQQVSLFPPPGQVQNIPPTQQFAKQPYFQQSGQAVHQRPVMQPSFPQQLPTTPTHLRPQGQSHVYQQPPQSIVANSTNLVGRPSVAGHGVQSQPYSQYAGGVSRPVYPGAYQQSTNHILKSSNQMPMPSEQQSSVNAKLTMSATVGNANGEKESEKPSVETNVTDEGKTDEAGKNSKETNHSVETQGGAEGEPIIMKEGNSEGAVSHFSNGELGRTVTNGINDVLNHGTLSVEDKKTVDGSDKVLQGVSIASAQFNGGFMDPPRPEVDQVTRQPLPSHSSLGIPHQTPPQSHFGPQGPGAFGPPSSGVFPARATPLGPDMKGMNGFDSSSPVLSRDERLRFQAERFNPSFPAPPNRPMPDRPEFLEDMRRFPRPFDRGPHELKMDSMAFSSRFLPPYEGVRGHLEDPFGRLEPSRGDPEFFGAGPSFGREHHDMFLRGYRGPGPDDIRGREVHRFGEPFGGPFPESRFSMLPSHLRRDEFDGPGSMGMNDRLRNDFLGHSRFSSHLHDIHSRGEPLAFEAHSHHARMREISGPGMDLFGRGDRPNHPYLGEPGFRSSFSHRGFPNDGGIITGELSFDISKKRKPPSVGWCRICKVDCETVEGLDLHSQTREHQKTTMDIVLSIKENAKRKKLNSGEQSLPRDESKSGNSGGDDRGKEN